MAVGISVIIPSYNPLPEDLDRLYKSLLAQRHDNFEVIVVDDGSTQADYSGWSDSRFRVDSREENRGPAACRNAGADQAANEFLFFTDTDCELGPDTLIQVAKYLGGSDAIAGNTVTRVETSFGKAVALLGFPGGGALGFDRVWRVDASGHAASFSSCNLAIRKPVLEALGKFNETFPVAGGEDTVLARRMVEEGNRIRYDPNQLVYHKEKRGLASFLRWQHVRGRGNYYIKQEIGSVGGYLRLRIWTFTNSFREAGVAYAVPVFFLLLLSVCCQINGYRVEKKRAAIEKSARTE